MFRSPKVVQRNYTLIYSAESLSEDTSDVEEEFRAPVLARGFLTFSRVASHDFCDSKNVGLPYRWYDNGVTDARLLLVESSYSPVVSCDSRVTGVSREGARDPRNILSRRTCGSLVDRRIFLNRESNE